VDGEDRIHRIRNELPLESAASVAGKLKLGIRLLSVVFLWAQAVAAQQLAHAQSSTTPVQFRIAAQPMDRALKEFASQARLQLIFATDDIASGTLAQAVSGLYSPEAALMQMLAKSCLTYKFVNTNTVSIESSRATCR
jgi:iron complex outermembrane recepter protein